MNGSRLIGMGVVSLVAAVASRGLGVNMDYVVVGDPGNAADTRYDAGGHGGVADVYLIGRYEVTNDQYVEFLNAVDPDGDNPYGIYNSSMGSGYGGIEFDTGLPSASKYVARDARGSMPVDYVDFWDACRFANWMHNGEGSGDTETGAYSLNGVLAPTHDVTRNPGAVVFLPSEDEWYKAAYYKGGGTDAGYWDYPTQSDASPTAEMPPGTDMVNGSANHSMVVGDLTDVGAYTAKPSDSAYGTYDQGGNVWEWTDTILQLPWRVRRGGSFAGLDDVFLHASAYDGWHHENEDERTGFRVARVPDPGTASLLALGVAVLLGRRRR